MKNLLQKKNASGFTIIEVIIVLAIAGLIMVVVFIAVPQLQRNQRNSAREAVVNRIATEATNYASNNTGNIPTADALAASGVEPTGGFHNRYILNNAAQFNDPSTGNLMLLEGDAVAAINTALGLAATPFTTVFYAAGAVCNGEVLAGPPAAQPRNFAIANRMEGGAVHCVDNR